MLESFEWVSLIPGLRTLPIHVVHTVLVVGILCLVVLVVNRRLTRADLDVVPPRRFGLLPFFEIIYETILGVSTEILGTHAPRFLYLVGGLAVFILFSNLLGLIPGFAPPTDNVNTTAACAITVFFATHIYGFQTHGVSYLKQFVGPTVWLAPLMIPIELIGHLARPLSLSLRLFGNMFGDHIVLAVFVLMMTSLTKVILAAPVFLYVFAPIAPLIPIVVMLLGIFVAVVQTYVFILLTMSYLSGAISEAH